MWSFRELSVDAHWTTLSIWVRIAGHLVKHYDINVTGYVHVGVCVCINALKNYFRFLLSWESRRFNSPLVFRHPARTRQDSISDDQQQINTGTLHANVEEEPAGGSVVKHRRGQKWDSKWSKNKWDIKKPCKRNNKEGPRIISNERKGLIQLWVKRTF